MGKKRVVACGFRVKLWRKSALFLRKSGGAFGWEIGRFGVKKGAFRMAGCSTNCVKKG